MFNIIKRRREVTLVLGGGSARGLAHIGVLSVFEREKIPIHRIVGTSMGALVGATYSLGMPVSEMAEHAYGFTIKKLLDPTVPSMGLLAGDKLEKTINKLIDHKTFQDCKIPLYVVATDIEKGEEVVYHYGDLSTIVRASCSWPGIFNPVKIDGRVLCDGGIMNSVPTKIAKTLNHDYIIAVDVGFCVRKGRMENIFQMILQSFQIMGHELNKYQSSVADEVINVDLGDIDQISFNRAREAVVKGREAAEQKITKIKSDIGL